MLLRCINLGWRHHELEDYSFIEWSSFPKREPTPGGSGTIPCNVWDERFVNCQQPGNLEGALARFCHRLNHVHAMRRLKHTLKAFTRPVERPCIFRSGAIGWPSKVVSAFYKHYGGTLNRYFKSRAEAMSNCSDLCFRLAPESHPTWSCPSRWRYFPYMNVRSTLNVYTLQISWKHETSRAATEPLWSSDFVDASLLATPRCRFVMFLRVSHRKSFHRFQNGTDK